MEDQNSTNDMTRMRNYFYWMIEKFTRILIYLTGYAGSIDCLSVSFPVGSMTVACCAAAAAESYLHFESD